MPARAWLAHREELVLVVVVHQEIPELRDALIVGIVGRGGISIVSLGAFLCSKLIADLSRWVLLLLKVETAPLKRLCEIPTVHALLAVGHLLPQNPLLAI